jgi:NTP pyrophosphatase (non-canonical NTP hydrolase)
MNDIDALKAMARTFRDERDWKQFHTPKDLAMDIAIEAGEVMEHFIWREGEEAEEYIKANKEDIEDELSDVLHGVVLLADVLDIDIMTSFEKKMRKNEKKYPIEKARGKNIKHTKL